MCAAEPPVNVKNFASTNSRRTLKPPGGPFKPASGLSGAVPPIAPTKTRGLPQLCGLCKADHETRTAQTEPRATLSANDNDDDNDNDRREIS
jgi:hypothetical protein